MKNKNILILGGTGFIGYNLSKFLSDNPNNNITIADNLSRGKSDSYIKKLISKKNVSLIIADFTKIDSFDLLEKDYDYFYMLASVVGVSNTLELPN